MFANVPRTYAVIGTNASSASRGTIFFPRAGYWIPPPDGHHFIARNELRSIILWSYELNTRDYSSPLWFFESIYALSMKLFWHSLITMWLFNAHLIFLSGCLRLLSHTIPTMLVPHIPNTPFSPTIGNPDFEISRRMSQLRDMCPILPHLKHTPMLRRWVRSSAVNFFNSCVPSATDDLDFTFNA